MTSPTCRFNKTRSDATTKPPARTQPQRIKLPRHAPWTHCKAPDLRQHIFNFVNYRHVWGSSSSSPTISMFNGTFNAETKESEFASPHHARTTPCAQQRRRQQSILLHASVVRARSCTPLLQCFLWPTSCVEPHFFTPFPSSSPRLHSNNKRTQSSRVVVAVASDWKKHARSTDPRFGSQAHGVHMHRHRHAARWQGQQGLTGRDAGTGTGTQTRAQAWAQTWAHAQAQAQALARVKGGHGADWPDARGGRLRMWWMSGGGGGRHRDCRCRRDGGRSRWHGMAEVCEGTSGRERLHAHG